MPSFINQKTTAYLRIFLFSLLLAAFCFGADAELTRLEPNHRRDHIQAYMAKVADTVTRLMDHQTGGGTGDLARELRRMQQELAQQAAEIPLEEIEASGLTMDAIRAFVMDVTDGKGMAISVVAHPRAIAQANRRLQRAGFDFLSVFQAPHAETSLAPVEKPLDRELIPYQGWQKARLAVSIGVAAGAGLIGGGLTPSGIATAVTAGALEFQFGWYSPWWAKNVWDKYGFRGNIVANALYGAVIALVCTGAEFVTGSDISFNAREFIVKSLAIGTSTFVASFGAMQIASSRMQQNGEFSEYGRFRLENYSVFWNNFGRVVALGAAGLGVKYEVGKLFEVSFGLGEVIGWGIQLSYLATVTSPFWVKLAQGDSLYDSVTKYRLFHQDDPEHPWNRGLWGKIRKTCATVVAGITNLYTPSRLVKLD